MKTLLLVPLLLLASCGDKSTPAAPATAAAKSIDSKWTSTTNGVSIDFTGITVPGKSSMLFLLKDGRACSCDLTTAGDKMAGIYTINHCLNQAGGTQTKSCDDFGGAGNYSVVANVLTLTADGKSATFTKVSKPN